MTANSAKHYQLGIEPIDVIEAWELNYNLGNVIKYIARAGHKPLAGGNADEVSDYEMILARSADITKAYNYLYREIHGFWPWEEDTESE